VENAVDCPTSIKTSESGGYWDNCAPYGETTTSTTTTVACELSPTSEHGCQCKRTWTYAGETHHCCAYTPDNELPWCYVENGTDCEGALKTSENGDYWDNCAPYGDRSLSTISPATSTTSLLQQDTELSPFKFDPATTTSTTRCPTFCRSPECVDGNFEEGGWLLDDGHCTAACSVPDDSGIRYCGLGERFESGDSILCSQCILKERTCAIFGDPHIMPFDRTLEYGAVEMYAYGDYWLVRSNRISIQTRYWASQCDGNSMTRALAVGGAFLDGNVLLIEPLDGRISWNGASILEEFPSSFSVPAMVYAEYHNEVAEVKIAGQHAEVRGVDIMLPLGVRITVNRYGSHLDAVITMREQDEELDGYCGNFNGDPADDVTYAIQQRMAVQVDKIALLFSAQEYSYLGCYAENVDDRDLPVSVGNAVDLDGCALACADYLWFGVQEGNQCWCGNSFGKHGMMDGCGDCSSLAVGMQCVFGFADSQQPPMRTLADCNPDTLERAEGLCTNAMQQEGVQGQELLQFKALCKFDVCFGTPEFAAQDAWAAHLMAPCASVADVQAACGLSAGDCGDGNNAASQCDVSSCTVYKNLGWWDGQIRPLQDGQATGAGRLTNVMELDHRQGICKAADGTLELCTANQCSRTDGGLRAEFFYMSNGLSSVDAIDGLSVADVVRVDEGIQYAETAGLWSGLSHEDRFAARWSGNIKITHAGTYTFWLTSDDGSKLYLDGQEVLDNDGMHTTTTVETTIELTAAMHRVMVLYFENTGNASITLEYSGEDTLGYRQLVPRGVLTPTQLKVQNTITNNMLGGLKAEYFFFSTAPQTVDAIDGLKPDVVRVDAEVNHLCSADMWDGIERSENFIVRWTGSLTITTGGSYTFYISSDDGATLAIDKQVVINSDGSHGMEVKTYTADLPSGVHVLELRYLQTTADSCMIFEYSGPDVDAANPTVKVVVPPTATDPMTLGGLKAQFFYLGTAPESTDVIRPSLTPDITRMDERVQYPATSIPWDGLTKQDNFAARWFGGLKVVEAGKYTFNTRSDDGSVLLIDGIHVVDNDGHHGMETKSGSLDLESGVHAIDLRYIEASDDAGMMLEYSGPDTSGEVVVIPPSALVLPQEKDGICVSTTRTTTPCVLGNPGGLRADFFYLPSPPMSTFIINAVSPDVTRVDELVNYPATRQPWNGLSKAENFAARWTGGLRISTGGTYTFAVSSNDGSVLMVNGEEVVNNDGHHGMETRLASVELPAGDHCIVLLYIQALGTSGLTFEYTGPDTGSIMITVPTSVLLVPQGMDTPAQVDLPPDDNVEVQLTGEVGGLLAQFFYMTGTPRNTSQITSLTSADMSRVDESIDYPASNATWIGVLQRDNLAIMWTGGIRITVPGVYTFSLTSDDGSVLKIDSQEVLNNDGNHDMQTVTGTMDLEEGDHNLVVLYIEGSGEAGITFKYSGPDTDGVTVIVPCSVLVLPEGAERPLKVTDMVRD